MGPDEIVHFVCAWRSHKFSRKKVLYRRVALLLGRAAKGKNNFKRLGLQEEDIIMREVLRAAHRHGESAKGLERRNRYKMYQIM